MGNGRALAVRESGCVLRLIAGPDRHEGPTSAASTIDVVSFAVAHRRCPVPHDADSVGGAEPGLGRSVKPPWTRQEGSGPILSQLCPEKRSAYRVSGRFDLIIKAEASEAIDLVGWAGAETVDRHRHASNDRGLVALRSISGRAHLEPPSFRFSWCWTAANSGRVSRTRTATPQAGRPRHRRP